MQSLIDQQLTRRQKLQQEIQPIIESHKERVQDLRQEIAKYMEMGGKPPDRLHEPLAQRLKHRDMDYTPEL